MAYADYEAVIGLEIHAQLKTKSKLFCRCSTEFGAGDNQNTCPVCTGMPGALPTINAKAVELASKIGLALGSQVQKRSVFARKNYFYPDMPLGYQISQYDQPICEGGVVEFEMEDGLHRIELERAHLEADAGKSTHHGDYSLINLNRSCVPLLEIVSKPEIRTPAEAAEYARTLRRLVRYLDACDGNLEEGSLRCDCNVSVRKKGETKLGTKVELKNINSFRFVEKAIQYEIERQIDCKETGEEIVQETRLYDSDKNRTFSMRKKEDAHDYRYFPEPDLLPLQVKDSDLQKWQTEIPELPLARSRRLQSEYGLSAYESAQITEELESAQYFETAVGLCENGKEVANWMLGDAIRYQKEEGLAEKEPVSAENLAGLVKVIDSGDISGKIAKKVFREMWETGKEAATVIQEKGLKQISDTGAVEKIIEEVLAANPEQVGQFLEGKEKVMGFLVGQVMKASKGQANPGVVNQLLKTKLQAMK